MRVAHIGPVPPALGGATPGGVATHLSYLLPGLAARGVQVPLLATNTAAPTPAQWRGDAPSMVAEDGRRWEGLPADWRRPESFAVFRLYQPRTARQWLNPAYLRVVGPARLGRYALAVRSPRALPPGSRLVALAHLLWYRRFLGQVRPDVIHVQHPLERHLYARLVQRLERWRMPLVVTLHSFFNEHPEALIQGLMRPNLRHAEAFIAVSRSTADQAVQLGADPAKVHVVRSGVDTTHFQPRSRASARIELGLPPDRPLVLFVGNLEPRKAVDQLLLALAKVRTRQPEVSLAIVGTGQSAGVDDQEPRLRQLAIELGLGGAVQFVGRVPEDKLLAWYSAADVFALPSLSEAQGIVALEAMACGLPVVASAVGGLLDTIRDGEDGFLVPPRAPDALAERLLELLGHPGLRERIGNAARAAVEREFLWARAAEETEQVYREVLHQWR